jgi:hypothetical protein
VETLIDWIFTDLKPKFKQSAPVRSSNILDEFGISGNNNDFEENSAPARKVSNIGSGAVGGALVKKAM